VEPIDDYPEYYPARPYTLVTDAPADPETGHEFVLHFDPEDERYYVFFFAEERHAEMFREYYNSVSTKRGVVVRFDPRGIEDRIGVRYTDADGKQIDMSIAEYRKNMEFKNEFRRDD
jgi:hypothetical protein